MSMTLLTAAYVQKAAYSNGEGLPEGITFTDQFDASTVQAYIYDDATRGRTGCVVVGSNERQDWLRNFSIVPVRANGAHVALGWLKGAKILSEWCEKHGVTELIGHSKGAAEALIAGWLVERKVQVLALASPKPFLGTPPLMDALCVRNPRDAVCKLPPFPGWYTPGTTVMLPWDPPDIGEDHRMGALIAALVRSGHGYLALEDGLVDEPMIEKRESRVMEKAQ